MAKVKDIDHGFKRIVATLTVANDSVVKVGFLDDGAPREDGDPVSNADLATIHEFGAPLANVPERSFMRSTFDEHRDEYMRTVERLSGQVIDGKMTLETALGLVGARMAADIKNTVTRGEGVPPPNTPETIKRKGSSRPLVDTGQMIGALTWAVKDAAGGYSDE